MSELEWESVGETEDGDPVLLRMRVLGGWLVSCAKDGGLCFVPDIEGEWNE